MTFRFRHRLLSVILLGVVTSGVSLLALVRILSVTTTVRIERARHELLDQLTTLAGTRPEGRSRVLAEPASWLIGLRGGFVAEGATFSLPDGARAARVSEVLARARASHAQAISEEDHGDDVFLSGAMPAQGGGYAWAAFDVHPPAYLTFWRKIVIALSLATLVLVTSATYTMVSVKRSAQALKQSLVALGDDLEAPLVRPSIRELGEVADGIGRLAQRLVAARQSEERLAADLARQERLAALGRVAAGVAHEVRNPLASIKLRLDLAAAQHPTLPPGVLQALAHASREIARLDRLVADLLAVAGRPVGAFVPVALGDLVQSRENALLPWAESRGVSFEAKGQAETEGDTDALARAVDNLLRNAVEASPRGGSVRVVVEREDARARVIVEDAGPGVPAEQVPQLFEPFFTTKAEGTGLGLAICQAIVRAHAGEITYARQGNVTRFILDLPARPRRDASAQPGVA